ncbi:Nucleoside transporter [Aphelenchoides bicaudatus]|nr:Nucleoside transporter [Aphelenchoides bicaudatus]
MREPLENDPSNLPIIADRAVLYGATEHQMASPQPPEKNADLEANTTVTADERVAFIESPTQEPIPPAVNKTALLVYFIFMLHGVGTLMPWNAFLTIAPSYFIGYKFTPIEPNEPVPQYSTYFFSYLGVCSQLPNVLLNFLNLFIVIKADLSKRIFYCLIAVALVLMFTITFVFIDTFTWMTAFFVLTMVSVVILNSANGVYQNSIYGLAAMFPQKFTNAVIIGNNLCGIFVTIVLILTLLFLNDVQAIAILYFSVALAVILACLFSFLWLPKLAFYSYHTNRAKRPQGTENSEVKENFTFNDFLAVLSQTRLQMLSVFLTFFVTLSIFPAVVANIPLHPIGRKYDFFLPENLYVPVTTFLNFNVFATAGNVLANYVQWPRNKDSLIYPVALRLLFIPFFLFCNFGGANRNSAPVFFTNEYQFIFMLALMSLSHGYFSSISMMYAPAKADEANAPKAGMMSAFFLVLGIFLGVSFTYVENFLFFK